MTKKDQPIAGHSSLVTHHSLLVTHYSLLVLFTSCLLFASLGATELRPWFGPDKLLELRGKYTYQHYSKIDTGGRVVAFHADDSFFNLSLAISPDLPWSFELEGLFDRTRHTRGFDCVRLTGRYLIMNDVIGNPLSVAAGITITRATHTALHDISSFHHGIMEYEAHLAAGKEFSCEGFWNSRMWGFVSFALADRGCPWMRACLAYERNYWDYFDYGVFIRGLLGFGSHDIPIEERFPGYSVIAHRSVELGIYYCKFIERFTGYVYGEYVYRPYAHNFPADAHLFTAGFLLPFNPL